MNQLKRILWANGLILASVSYAGFFNPCNAQDLTGPSVASNESATDPANLQSAAERTMDWLNEQIAPPSESAEAGSALRILSDPNAKRSAIKTGATLTLVISLFLLVVFLWRMKPGGRKTRKQDNQVLAVLGKVPFVHGQHLQLVRLGTRLLLVASSPKGSQTLAEISDPAEVLQLEAAFREGRMDVLTESLHQHAVQTKTRPAGISLGSHQNSGRTLLEA